MPLDCTIEPPDSSDNYRREPLNQYTILQPKLFSVRKANFYIFAPQNI